MHYKFLNINDAFYGMVKGIHEGTIPTHVQASRYGECMTVEESVILTYERPRERVLFNAARDCNPIFHLYESLYLLAGRNDVSPLAYYNSRMKEFSDDGKVFNGSYGYRWRHAEAEQSTPLARQQAMEMGWDVNNARELVNIDQLQILIQHLKNNPHSRRAVLSMWNVEDDLLKIGSICPVCKHQNGANGQDPAWWECSNCHGKGEISSKDVACNLSACFLIRQGMCLGCGGTGQTPWPRPWEPYYEELDTCSKCNGKPHDQPRYLDITVFNRSNDLIWGALGANYVHFGVLQEYVAAHLGLEVGVYNQITNNLHAYTNNWKPEEWLAYYGPMEVNYGHGEPNNGLNLVPLVQNPAVFDQELPKFVEWHSKSAFKYPDPYDREDHKYRDGWQEPFLRTVAEPMMLAFHVWKQKELKWQERCLAQVDKIAADDWRIACKAWLERRIAKRAQV